MFSSTLCEEECFLWIKVLFHVMFNAAISKSYLRIFSCFWKHIYSSKVYLQISQKIGAAIVGVELHICLDESAVFKKLVGNAI